MDFSHWLAFAAASGVLILMPGPTLLLVVSYALAHGRKVAGAMVAGVALGDFTSMTASLLGLGALLAASATLFTVLKLIGAAYLVYLGIKIFTAPVGEIYLSKPRESSRWRIFLHSYLVTATNPKGIVFFVAFLPQFLIPGEDLLPQFVVYEITFIVMATANAAAYALLASRARQAIKRPSVQRWVNRIGGGFLISGGIAAALIGRE